MTVISLRVNPKKITVISLAGDILMTESMKPGRGADQFPLRLPEGMRDQIKNAAAKSGRSMNAEIIDRLEDSFTLDSYSDFPGFSAHDKIAMMSEELAKANTALEKARHDTEVAQAFRDDLAYMSNMLRQMHEEDRATLKELEEVIYFLEADRVRLEARVNDERIIPSNDGPGPLKSRFAQRLAWAVDERMGLLARLATKLMPIWAEAIKRRAHVAMHSVELSPEARELAEIYADNEDHSTSSDFADYILSMTESMPEDRQDRYRAAVNEIMPRLFLDWKSDDPFFRD